MHPFTKQYPGKRAFITGAASGLGLACCKIFAKDGWTIGMVDMRADNLQLAVEEIRQLGANVIPISLDVSDKDAYKIAADDFLAETGGIDILFNNAGVGDGGYFEEYALENWEWMVGVNQMSVVYGCHIFIPTFKKQGYGHIINTASLAAVSSAPLMGAYNMTKAAVVSISETLYTELMDHNIKVSCLMPYYFRTNVAEQARGGEKIKQLTDAMMTYSGLRVEAVSEELMLRSAKGELYILLPDFAKKMWLYKRLFPTRFRKTVRDGMAKVYKKLKL
jgi:NADP-dependent 3-hydroxy acid dehydrogenase YdfG